jgi:hypothetical protein
MSNDIFKESVLERWHDLVKESPVINGEELAVSVAYENIHRDYEMKNNESDFIETIKLYNRIYAQLKEDGTAVKYMAMPVAFTQDNTRQILEAIRVDIDEFLESNKKEPRKEVYIYTVISNTNTLRIGQVK